VQNEIEPATWEIGNEVERLTQSAIHTIWNVGTLHVRPEFSVVGVSNLTYWYIV
jgi:hypothetical protein